MKKILESAPSLEEIQRAYQRWLSRTPFAPKQGNVRSSVSLILDWQKDSVLLARGHGSGASASLHQLSFQPMGKVSENQSVSPQDAVRLAVSQSGQRGEVTVLVARELVELRTLQIPKIDPDELPDVIRFQAQRQFANMTDAWSVDFVMLPPSAGNELQTALVAAMPPAILNEIESACSAAGLQIAHIAFRPLEIARLSTPSSVHSSNGRSMIVCVSDAESDLLLIRGGRVVQVRSTNLPTEPQLVAQALQGEVRRSLFAAAAELDGQPIESVLLVASASRAESLKQSLQTAAKAPVECYHPEKLLSAQDQHLANQAAARLAGMAGALSLSTADPLAVIDFKRPKRRPPQEKNTRTWILAGAATAALFLLGLLWYTSRINGLNSEYEGYRTEIEAKKEMAETAEIRSRELSEIENFLSSSPNWLDELTYIAQRMPGADKVMLDNPIFSVIDGGGMIKVGVKADSSTSLSDFEESIRSQQHRVSGTGAAGQLTSSDGIYRWAGASSISVSGRGWSIADAVAPPQPPEAAAVVKETAEAVKAEDHPQEAQE